MASPIPALISVAASQDFVGNDGPWSSFTIQIGTPAQDVEVFISTAGYQTWAVAAQGCTSSDPPNCATLRGSEFVPHQSSSWTQNNVTANGTFTLELETNLGYSGNGAFGYDTVALGWQGSGGPSLEQQIVAGIATPDFYLGIFGLNPRPTNFTNFNDPVPSYMSTLKQRSMIPSLSWSYTAGNQYRLNKILGSLTLGGYDTSRFVPNDLSFAFNQVDGRDLVVDIETMTFSTGNSTISLLKNSIPAFIDSTVPYFYLPLSVCQEFERAFGIAWDDDVQAYLVNATLHAQLQAQNATVTISLGNSSSEQFVNISLPYAAFDLTATYPLLTNSSGYFPLMRATNESQYTLGRAFLQEAYVFPQSCCRASGITSRRYLIADYERRNFSVSQCSWNAGAQQDIVAITSQSEEASSSATKPIHSRGLSSGQIVGIIIGGLAGLLIFVAIIIKANGGRISPWKMRKKEHKLEASVESEMVDETCTKVFEIDGEGHQVQESDGRQYPGHEIDGQKIPGHELGAIEPRYELGGSEHPKHEFPAFEFSGGEMPVPGNPPRVKSQEIS